MSKKVELISKLAGILELPSARETDQLCNWDSLAVVSAMVAIEEVTGNLVSGQDLTDCATVGDVLTLAGVA